MKISTKNRCSLWGTKAIAITSILIAIMSGCGHDRMDTEPNPPNKTIEVSVNCTSRSTTLSTLKAITTSMTSKTSTTSTAATTLKKGRQTTQNITNNPSPIICDVTFAPVVKQSMSMLTDEINVTTTAIYIEPTEYTEQITTSLPITDQEFILLANVVSHEAGCDWLTEYDRACIVAAIMNRVSDSRFPDTIDEVVHQKGQMFDVPYYRVDYSTLSRELIDNAVYAYFNGTYEFGNINSWSGDGTKNYFYYQ